MVSLELVGEFFEVRTQVDRDLTTVGRVDRRLGLIKNLGHHSAPPRPVADAKLAVSSPRLRPAARPRPEAVRARLPTTPRGLHVGGWDAGKGRWREGAAPGRATGGRACMPSADAERAARPWSLEE
jgi:hypothetical protein